MGVATYCGAIRVQRDILQIIQHAEQAYLAEFRYPGDKNKSKEELKYMFLAYPKGVVSARVTKPSWGRKFMRGNHPQGSDVVATLGYETKSRWDSIRTANPWKV